tara:strand:+ start:116 stop:358 length:243 start_codon:yes stop_codon:yes gene_type:complete
MDLTKFKIINLNNMNITQEQEDTFNIKTELVNDLVATTTVIDELWRYHPDNPEKKDVELEYEILKQIQKDIESELAGLGK